ncbi:MAG: SDR family NAD(P)-dependent oxidoreductase [Gammaproteobacteria bacterium]|nr:SDR family NAD(P)-dependent oxidoreductase [Gammaproteobacteria bacterium]
MFKIFVDGLVVFVTGANRRNGIGRALVEEAIKRGAKKVYATARNISQLDDLVARFQGKVVPIELDVTNLEHIQRTAQRANDTQVLVNNAGVSGFSGCIYNYDEKRARQEMEVNYFGPLRLMNAFAKKLIKNGNGAIVNIISIGGLYPSPELITYSASKAALYSLTRSVRIEMMKHSHSIPVFGVYPGPIDTDMKGIYANVESSANVAIRVFDGMERGTIDITTDPLSDNFVGYLKTDTKIIDALKEAFNK